jgi:hypothetical protein
MYFSPATMSAAKYDECIARLTKAGALHPVGRTYHVCLRTGDQVQVFDVWDSQAEFDAFGATLLPILQSLGVDPGQPMVSPVHKVITPPAMARRATSRRAKAASKKKTAKKPRAKKGARRGR